MAKRRKEHNVTIAEGLARGLRQKEDELYGPRGLSACDNLKATERALVAFSDVTVPFNSAEFISAGIIAGGGDIDDYLDSYGKYCYLFDGVGATILICPIYSDSYASWRFFDVTKGTVPWSLTARAVYDMWTQTNDVSSSLSISNGGQWQFVEMQGTWIALNGYYTVYYRRPVVSVLADKALCPVSTQSLTTCGCFSRGRIFLGGFDPANFWSVDMESDWLNVWVTKDSDTNFPTTVSYLGLRDNFVWYGAVGGGDLFFRYATSSQTYNYAKKGEILKSSLSTNPFDPVDYDADGTDDLYRPLIYDFLLRGDGGWVAMPYEGLTHVLKPLGNKVVAYGENGVAVLIPYSQPVPCIGTEELLPIGILSRGAVGGDKHQHVFVTKDGAAYSLAADLQLRKLDYKEFLSTLDDGLINVSFNPTEREFHLADSTTGYLLSQTGLSASPQSTTTSLAVYEGVLYGVANNLSGSQTATVRTNTLDFGVRGIKNIKEVKIHGYNLTSAEVSILYRYDSSSAFTEVTSFLVNDEGIAYPQVAGLEFQVEVEGTIGSGAKLEAITIWYEVIDGRG